MKRGIARPGNVLYIPPNQETVDHPAVFPVKLPEFFIKLTTDEGEIIYEPFGGAGTTLMAAEVTGRTAMVMELMPKYCDVIITRWESYTGQKAVRADG